MVKRALLSYTILFRDYSHSLEFVQCGVGRCIETDLNDRIKHDVKNVKHYPSYNQNTHVCSITETSFTMKHINYETTNACEAAT